MKLTKFGYLVACMLVLPIGANASSITWNLVNVLESDGSTLNGSFTTDVTNSQLLTWNFIKNGGLTSGYTFSNTITPHYIVASTPTQIEVGNDSTNNMGFTFANALIPSVTSNPITASDFNCGACGGIFVSGNSGMAVQVVPIPAAAWLLGSGLLGLIGMARRKAA